MWPFYVLIMSFDTIKQYIFKKNKTIVAISSSIDILKCIFLYLHQLLYNKDLITLTHIDDLDNQDIYVEKFNNLRITNVCISERVYPSNIVDY